MIDFHTRNINEVLDQKSMVNQKFSKGNKNKIYPGKDSLDEITLIYPSNVSLEM
jgi:hypothetical protein